MSKQAKFKNYTKQELINAAKNSQCWSDVCRLVDVTICTFNFRRLQALCAEYKISTEHFNIKATFKRNKHYWTMEEIFTRESRVNKTVLRNFIRRNNILKLQCLECGIKNEWNRKPIVLEIDHINGKSSDNRIENLRMLCPNCHSQTNTYRRRTL